MASFDFDGCLVRDGDAHWYFVPEGLVNEFFELSDGASDCEEDDTDTWAEFEEKFSQYRLGCHPSRAVFRFVRWTE